MKFLRAEVPCKSKNMSSLFLTRVSNLGKTLIILLNYSGYSFAFVYFRRKHNKSKIYYNIDVSTI